jgi:UPF0042 nucleotide-binding protein
VSATAPAKQIVVITGMSGSGKSTAIRALEDLGFFCIDNLPILLIPKLIELANTGDIERLGLVIDARERSFLVDAPRMLEDLRRAGHTVEVVFLDSSDESLVRRFSETRRRHPLAPNGSVAEGIALERNALKDLRELADQIVDSSPLNVHDLKRLMQARFGQEAVRGPSLTIMSFGYRYGVPPQADVVLDVRFLPNPYFVPELRGFTGIHPDVSRYVLEREDSQEFLSRLQDFCSFLFPRYQREGKAYLTVALGCTGGKHRSVALAHEFHRRLSESIPHVQVWDRDAEKE